MPTQLKNFLGKIRYGDKWMEKRLEKCLYFIKWKQIQKDIKNAKAYDDRKAVQNFYIGLQWLISINEFAFDEEIKYIRQESFCKQLDELNTIKIQSSIYLRFKEDDLVSPAVFDVENNKHRKFAFDIIADYETIIHQTKFEGLAMEEKSLSFPKTFIYKTLSFFLLYCNYDDHGVTKDYALELKDTLEKFN